MRRGLHLRRERRRLARERRAVRAFAKSLTAGVKSGRAMTDLLGIPVMVSPHLVRREVVLLNYPPHLDGCLCIAADWGDDA